MVNEMTDQNGL